MSFICTPFYLWLENTGNPIFYLSDYVPIGQGFYVWSKIFALWTLLLFGIQIIVGLANVHIDAMSKERFHICLGLAVFSFMFLHIAGFIAGTTLRSGHFTGHFLLPDIDDYYHARITVGLFSLLLVFTALLSRLLSLAALKCWGHRLMIPAFYLSSWHALAIGTESRHPVLQSIIIVLMVTVAFLCLYRAKILYMARVS